MVEKKKKTTKKKKAVAVKEIGRPTKYEPRFCEMVVDHMAQGLSFESFAGVLGVTKQTIYNWTKENPEFLDAKERGSEKCRLFWEKTGIDGITGKIQGFNAAAWIFNLKNRFQWRDKQPDERDDKTFEPIVIDLPVAGRKIEIANKKDRK